MESAVVKFKASLEKQVSNLKFLTVSFLDDFITFSVTLASLINGTL